jgi:hypothetical protein
VIPLVAPGFKDQGGYAQQMRQVGRSVALAALTGVNFSAVNQGLGILVGKCGHSWFDHYSNLPESRQQKKTTGLIFYL